jgi:acetaldehyde dehydrogenase (acetylating)
MEVIRRFALEKPAFRICVNTPAALGAVGYTTNLFPSMTLGCGAAGGNITSDNISPLHLINLKRVAWGVREYVAGEPGRASESPVSGPSAGSAPGARVDRLRIASVVDSWLEGRNGPVSRTRAAAPPESRPGPPAVSPPGNAGEPEALPVSPPLGSYSELDAPASQPLRPPGEGPVDFVCEDDVRKALRANGSIEVNARTIITPSARDLGEREKVFLSVD